MTKEYVQAVGRMAYIWGWPLVNLGNRSVAFSNFKQPVLVGGVVPANFNGVCMLTDYVSPDQRGVACPNQDVVYGFGLSQLENEPLVLQVPDFGERFWVYPLYDQRTDEFSALGKPYGTKPGFYLVVGPDWQGEKPVGITAILRSPTSTMLATPRVFLDDTAEDRATIQPIINQINFYPLSRFTGKMQSVDWSKTPSTPAAAGGSGETKWVQPEKFFDQLPGVMEKVPPLPGEEALYGWFESVLDAAATDPQVAQTLKETAVATENELFKSFLQWKYVGRPAGNGWNSPVNNAQWGTDYLNRAATARSNILENRPEETKYLFRDLDANGDQLHGRNLYQVTFPPGQLPDYQFFWSITMYGLPDRLLVPNPIRRYSIGSDSPDLKLAADGSLTIYIQKDSPGAAKESNWLPAPDSPFSAILRVYGPGEAEHVGQWKAPALVRTK